MEQGSEHVELKMMSIGIHKNNENVSFFKISFPLVNFSSNEETVRHSDRKLIFFHMLANFQGLDPLKSKNVEIIHTWISLPTHTHMRATAPVKISQFRRIFFVSLFY